MCGILGYVGETLDRERFTAALARLDHRGPFARGQASDGKVTLGMTRLPMSSAEALPLPVALDGVVVAYNGEVYDGDGPRSLPGEIACLARGLRTGRLPDGMYAFALHDRAARTLHVGRDALGIKPLYCVHDQAHGVFAFASEVEPLLFLLGPFAVDRDALAEIAILGTALDDATPFRGIRLVKPGELLRIDCAPGAGAAVRASRLGDVGPGDGEGLDERLGLAVERCRTTFRDVGLLVSGGLDSNLLSTYLSPSTKRFHVAVDGVDDVPPATPDLAVTSLGAPHFWPLLAQAVTSFGAPTRMSSILMYQALARLIGDHGYHCVLLGEGADEVFWGYPRHLTLLARDFVVSAEELARLYFGDYRRKARALGGSGATSLVGRVEEQATAALADGVDAAIQGFDRRYSLEPLLRRADHLLMSRTIEARTPFLHNGLPRAAARLGRKNLGGGQTKAPLRQLMATRWPGFAGKPKAHFRVPFDRWPSILPQMREHLARHRETLGDLGLGPWAPPDLATMDPAELFTLTTVVLWHEAYSRYLQ